MTTATQAQYKSNLKRFRKALSGRYKVQQSVQSAYVVGDGHIKIDGRYYDASTSGMSGSTANVVNIGRPAAAVYALESGGSVSVVSSGTSTTSSGGGGSGAPVDVPYLTLATNGTLTAERVLMISDGLSYADAGSNSTYTISLATPESLSVSTTNTVGTGHAHAISASSNPGAASWLLKSASDGGLTLTTLEATTSVTTPLVSATTKVTTPLIDTASGDVTIDPASRILEVDGTIVSRTSTTANVGAILQNTTDVDNSYSRIAIGYNAHWDFDNNLWEFGAAGANDSATLLVRNGSAAIDLVFHVSASSSTRTMDHSTFAAGTKFTLTNAGRLGILNTAPSYELDVTGTARATTALISPTVTTTTINSASGDITLAPADDVMLDPASNLVKITSGVSLQSDNYVSQVTGWRATYDGQADFRYLFVDEMHAKSFIADLEQALAGGQIIAKSVAILYSAFTAPAASGTATLVVRDLPSATGMAVFVNGDYVRIRTFSRSGGSLTIADCWGTVVLDTTYGTSGFDSSTKTQRYTFTRSASPNAGAMSSGTVVAADAIILDYGTSGNGYYEVNAIDGMYGANSPYSQIVTWSGHPRTQTVRARLGNLYGIWSSAGEYGLYAGSGVTDNDSYLRISNSAVRLNNVPLQLYDGGIQTVNIDSTGNDIWVGTSPTDKKLRWNGVTLAIEGNVVITGGSGIASLSDAGNLATANDLDDVVDGSTYYKTNANQVQGASRAYTAINSSNNLVTSVIPTTAITPSGAGLYLGSNYMGYYSGSAWKTYIDSSGNFKFLGSASNNYIQWVAASNKLQGVGGGTEQWYASATDGKLYAGGGTFMADAIGVHIGNASGTDRGLQLYRTNTLTNSNKAGGLWVLSDLGNIVNLYAGRNVSAYGDSGNSNGELSLIGYGSGGSSVSITLSGSSNYISVNGQMRTGTLRPTTTNTDDLGTSSYYYNAAYIRTVNADALSISGNIAVTGTVDGVDIAAFKSNYDSHTHSGYLATSGGTMTGTLTARNITFSADNTYDIGESAKRVQDLYVVNLHADTIVGTPSYAHSHDADYVNVGGDTMTSTLVMAFDNFAMITLDRTANANVDNTWNIGVSYISSTANDYAFFGKSDALQVFSDSSVKINNSTVWHAGNDGAGSGLDADTLDGVQGSGYALSGHNHTGVYVPVGRIVGGGTAIEGGGNLGGDIVLSHADTSGQLSVTNSNGNVIRSVGLDGMGHVISLASVDLDGRYMQTLTQGAGISITGTAPTLTIAHADTSSQGTVTGSGTTFVYGMTFDTYGHVQTVTTSDIGTALDSRFVNVTGDTMTGALILAYSSPTLTVSNTATTQYSRSAISLRNDTQAADEEWTIFAEKATAGAGVGAATFQIRKKSIDNTIAATPIVIDASNNVVLGNGYTAGGATNGNVGIKKTPGSYALDVSGSAAVSTSVLTPTVTTTSGNLTLTSVGGTVAVTGALTGSSTATFTSTITAASNTDANNTLGRAIVGYATGTDTATFAHFDNNTSTNYALTQSAAGATKLNSASGQSLDLAIANTSQFTVNTERMLPRSSVAMDLGDYNRKLRTIYATELAVTTLVAEEVISTIGGQVIVGETTKLIADISSGGTVGGSDALYTNMVAYWSLDETSGTRLDSLNTSHLADKNTVASIGGKQGTSALFVRANSERLTTASNSSLVVGDINFYLSCWVYATSDDGNTHCVLSKGGSSGDRAFALNLDWSDNRFEFVVYNSSDATTTVNSSVTVSVNTWYFVECWHNAASNLIGVAVNTTSSTASHTTGVKTDTGQFTIGSLGFTNYLSGRVDEVYYAKNYIPDSTRRTWMYNSGNGRTFVEVFNYGVGAFTMDVEHNFLQSGDYVYMQAAPSNIPQFEVFQITSTYTAITGGYRYSAIRNLDGTGANAWYVGDAVTSLGGAAGEGYINLTATTTLHNHYGPTIAHYVRTGTGTWDAVKPVVASGNLRSFVDYSSDVFGHAAGNDLLLAPDEGFRGYTCDTNAGMRLFNVDLKMYTNGVLTSRLDNTYGYILRSADALTTDYVPSTIKWYLDPEALTGEVGNITCYDLPTTGSQMRISVRPSPDTTYASMSLNTLTAAGAAGIGIGEYSGATYISINAALTELNGGNLRVGGSGKHIEAREIWAYTSSGLALCDDAGGVALSVIDSTRYVEIATRLYTPTINALGGTTTFMSNISMSSASIDMNSNNITEVGLLSMTGDIDLNGNDIIDIGQIGTGWTGLSFASGWENYNLGYEQARYKKVGDLVFLQGLVKRTSGTSLTIGTLPAGYRPPERLLLNTWGIDGAQRIDVLADGTIVVQLPTSTSFVSLCLPPFSTI